ncbi:hypothetical protein F4781DRAFT_435502 [Annulohypoxylon bovei var. microspora]|nr:hypothetical protein F4781DRAFT_435502 [Annulohypoxylon bovei var. microspora]
MITKTTILQALLISTCLISTGSSETGQDQVAWLREVQNDDSVYVPNLERSDDAPREVHEATYIKESAEKRDPKKKPNSNNNTTNQNDDSGAGKADMSMSSSIGVGLFVAVAFLY